MPSGKSRSSIRGGNERIFSGIGKAGVPPCRSVDSPRAREIPDRSLSSCFDRQIFRPRLPAGLQEGRGRGSCGASQEVAPIFVYAEKSRTRVQAGEATGSSFGRHRKEARGRPIGCDSVRVYRRLLLVLGSGEKHCFRGCGIGLSGDTAIIPTGPMFRPMPDLTQSRYPYREYF